MELSLILLSRFNNFYGDYKMKFRKALHIAQKECPWLTLADIMEVWQMIKEIEDDDENKWTAQHIADFACDIARDL